MMLVVSTALVFVLTIVLVVVAAAAGAPAEHRRCSRVLSLSGFRTLMSEYRTECRSRPRAVSHELAPMLSTTSAHTFKELNAFGRAPPIAPARSPSGRAESPQPTPQERSQPLHHE
jgi:hypothetical protein